MNFTARRDVDDEWAEIAEQVPGGWGGVVIDGDRPAIWMVDPSKANEVVPILATKLPMPYVQMRDWYRYLQQNVDWIEIEPRAVTT